MKIYIELPDGSKFTVDNNCRSLTTTEQSVIMLMLETVRPGRKEPTEEHTLTLVSAGDNGIAAIKAVRAITNLGLREAKDLVESVMNGKERLLYSGTKQQCENLAHHLTNAGCRWRIVCQTLERE